MIKPIPSCPLPTDLSTFCSQIVDIPDPTSLFQFTVDSISHLQDWDYAALLRPHPNHAPEEGHIMVAVHGWNTRMVGYQFLSPECISHRAASLDELICINDLRQEPESSIPAIVSAQGIQAVACAPMRVGNADIGTLLVHSHDPRRLDEREKSLLQNVANMAAIAIHRLELSGRNKSLNARIRATEARYNNVLDNAVEGILRLNNQGYCLFANRVAGSMLGFPRNEALIGKDFSALFRNTRSPGDKKPDQNYQLEELCDDIDGNGPCIRVLSTARGTEITAEIRARQFYPQSGDGFILSLLDVTAHHQSNRKVRLSEKVFDSSGEGIIITDQSGRIRMVNRAFSEITGYSQQEAIGQTPNMLRSGKHDDTFYRDLWQTLEERGEWHGEIWNRRKNGEVYPQWLTINRIASNSDESDQYVGLFTDISERKDTERRLTYMATHDSLTSLPNRALFKELLKRTLASARRSDRYPAVLFIDIDNFKHINDTLGHNIGDQLIRMVGSRMKNCLRRNDIIARLGGDEFGVMVDDIHSPLSAEIAANKIQGSFTRAFQIQGSETYITASIGIAIAPNDGESVDDLIKHADAAMYKAKAFGRSQLQFFDAGMIREASEQLVLQTQLRHALEERKLHMHYQPQVDLQSGQMVGCEALMRWIPIDGHQIPPDHFIPAAESNGLILAMGRWGLSHSCQAFSDWKHHGDYDQVLAFNLSGRQLQEKSLHTDIVDILSIHQMEPYRLELELTETFLIQNPELAHRSLAKLKDIGVRLALDDFGTGYASMSNLKRYPIDTVKIDKSFVQGVPSAGGDTALTKAIVDIGHAMGAEVVAEGVETEEQLDFLRKIGCDQAQGYLFSAAVDAETMNKNALHWSTNGFNSYAGKMS